MQTMLSRLNQARHGREQEEQRQNQLREDADRRQAEHQELREGNVKLWSPPPSPLKKNALNRLILLKKLVQPLLALLEKRYYILNPDPASYVINYHNPLDPSEWEIKISNSEVQTGSIIFYRRRALDSITKWSSPGR